MKKNITINLCGRLFQIDEDAYELLQHYIESLRSSFGRQEGGDEIVNDIEARIAELFDELRQNGIEAITIDHVKEIISRIGNPEELTGEEERKDDKKKPWDESARSAAQNIYDNVRSRTAGKKLYRNPKDKMVAGVLSGFAAYTNTDPVIWRLLTVLFTLFYGTGLILYIILAIVLPEAKTPEQQLQMEGKDVTPQNLADVVVDKDEQPVQRPSLLRSLFSLLLKIVFGFFVGIALIVCVALCVAFLGALVALVSALAFPASITLPFSLDGMGLAELYQNNPAVLVVFIIALFMLLLIPIYAIIHMVLTLTGKTQPMGIVQRIVWILLWIAALCCIVPCAITMEKYSEKYHQKLYNERHTYQGVVMNDDDKHFLRQGDWTLLKHENCAHYTWSGQYYTGDRDVRYLDAYNDACREVFQAERKEAVTPGVYRLDCLARAEGPGTFIYAIADGKSVVQIPPYGDKGGELVNMIQDQLTDSLTAGVDKKHNTVRVKMLGLEIEINGDDIDIDDERIDSHRVKEGFGWSIVSIDNIEVTGDSIAYGLSSDESFTGKPCNAKWFSATDFKLTRTGDLPPSVRQKK